ncbi:MAG: hypothetical protein ACWA5W_02025 [Phycisphaerales bacterium]
MNKIITPVLLLSLSIPPCLSLGFAADPSSEEPSIREQFGQRLGSLNPNNIDQYFILGEDILRSAQTPSDHQLAQQVFAVGAGLALEAGDNQTASSLVIALADSASSPADYATLWDIALLLDPRRKTAWSQHRNNRADENQSQRDAALKCLYAVRFSQYREAAPLWEDQHIRATILQTAQEIGLDPTQVRQTIETLLEQAANDSCRGRVFLTKRENGQTSKVVCPDHSSPLGIGFSEQSLKMFIKLELAMLDAQSSSIDTGWQTEAYLDHLTPIRLPTIDDIFGMFQVDPARPYWRRGRWTAKDRP